MEVCERALKALSDRHVFCNLMAEARQYKFSKYWDGSAYRCHPVGVIDGTIKMTNEWHTSDSCSIAITDGDGWDAGSVSQDSFGHGSPHPKPINGRSITVWDSGKWASEELRASLEPRVLTILTAIAEHSISEKAKKEAKAAAAARDYQKTLRETELTAIAKATA